jgi:hypothetical protein
VGGADRRVPGRCGCVELAEGTRVGRFNLITRVGSFKAGCNAYIGTLNVIRGGERVTLGDCVEVIRLNVLNAIPDHDCMTEPQSVLDVGTGTVITSGRRIDCTDRVTLGRRMIIRGCCSGPGAR